ncbi:complement C1q-like protein 4 [Mizuhopecten yessoensis]|uniref:complement C1q-like protein 4 n=1 Tax=Mizuhopecten yessoensis TaxID=6573 RepID=UPI000B45C3D6|nr:complement C1q-like protein 4 [Mizuhopecten yessoensis]XP_021364326.1 complement C1q-like protein 4 [Mizuhopecten yessoensis]
MLQKIICVCLLAVASANGEDRASSGDQPGEVAFSAGLTNMLTLTHTERVLYDRIYTNIGSSYHSNTGTFVCPTAGIYVFQFHSVAHQNKAAWLQLYKNFEYVASTYGHTSNDYASTGNSVILHLSKGDEVYIQAVDPAYGYATNLYGANDEVYCTFSGYMISPVFEEIPGNGK